MKVGLLITLCLYYLSQPSIGSLVQLNASPNDVKDGLTSDLSIRCGLKDTSASSAIVGKRDVTQTPENVMEVTSFIIMKDGNDVASISHTKPARVMDGATNVQTTGSLSGTSGDQAYLQMVIHKPGPDQVGEYVCEANAVNDSGHTVKLTKSIEVTNSTPTTADLIAEIVKLKEETSACCQIKPEVYFSAALEKHLTISSGVVVFDKVYSNVGGAYDSYGGLFTCNVAGYYRFDLNALAQQQHQFYFYLQVNGTNVIPVYARGGSGNQGGSSNNVIIHLDNGDVVRVVTHGPSYTYGTALDHFVTLNGQLISAD